MTGTLRGRLAVVAWLLAATTAGAFGLLLIEEEPGATAGRWYLGSAAGFAAVGIWARVASEAGHARWILAAATVATLATVSHTAWIVAFAYHGPSTILVVLVVAASVMTTFGVHAWERRVALAGLAPR
jgi:hypothetical protein